MTLGTPCAAFGTMAFNVNYALGAQSLTATQVSYDSATKTVKVVVSAVSGTSSVGTNTAPTYTPSAGTIKDIAGNAMAANAFNGTPSRF